MNGASKQAKERESGPVLQSVFLAALAYSGGEKEKNADLHHLSVVSLCLYPLDAGLSICLLLYLSVLMSLFSITSSVHPFLCPSCPSFFIMLRYIIYNLESLWNLL